MRTEALDGPFRPRLLEPGHRAVNVLQGHAVRGRQQREYLLAGQHCRPRSIACVKLDGIITRPRRSFCRKTPKITSPITAVDVLVVVFVQRRNSLDKPA